MIIADTGAIVALVDRKDRHHRILRKAFESQPAEWLLPWAILPEVDYLLGVHVGGRCSGRVPGRSRRRFVRGRVGARR